MQPIQKFNKTLLAGAFILGTCNTFTASAIPLTVSAEAVPDVTAGPVAGFTQVSFGSGVIGNKVGDSCIMQGISEIDDDQLLWNASGVAATNPNAGNVNGTTLGTLSGNGCVNGAGGEVMLIEIDGADASTVTVTVNDVDGPGGIWTYTPTAQSCVVDFDRVLNSADFCRSLAANTVTGIGMSSTQLDSVAAAANMDVVDGAQGFSAIVGKTRMVLAGSLTINSDLGQGTIVGETITVQVTYE